MLGDLGHVEVGIARRRAMPGEVLRAARDSGALRPLHPRGGEGRDRGRIVAERPRPDDRVARLAVHVADGGVIHGDAVRREALRDRARRAARVADLAGRGDRHRAREHRAIGDTHDGAALLIDGDRDRRQPAAARRILHLPEHRADLLLRADVLAEREEQDPADPANVDSVEERARRALAIEACPYERAGSERDQHDEYPACRMDRASVSCPNGRPRRLRVDFSRTIRRI